MSRPEQAPSFTFDEYVTFELGSEHRHEFLDGEVRAMGGGTVRHARLATRVLVALATQMRGSTCEVYGPDLMLWIPSARCATYADASVLCGPPQHYPPESELHVTNPTLVVEVTSRSTEAYDRGQKLTLYATLESLRGYVIVSHHERRLEGWTRPGAGAPWVLTEARDGVLPVAGYTFPVSDIYDGSGL
jgi:Uma2 family endonuclease